MRPLERRITADKNVEFIGNRETIGDHWWPSSSNENIRTDPVFVWFLKFQKGPIQYDQKAFSFFKQRIQDDGADVKENNFEGCSNGR